MAMVHHRHLSTLSKLYLFEVSWPILIQFHQVGEKAALGFLADWIGTLADI